MRINFRILREHGLVHAWTIGEVRDRDLSVFRARLAADPDFNPDFNELVECLSIVPPALSRAAIMEAAMEPIYSSKSRRAIVAACDAAYGLARMFAALQPDDAQVRVFRDLPGALEWLGLSANLVAPTDPATLVPGR